MATDWTSILAALAASAASNYIDQATGAGTSTQSNQSLTDELTQSISAKAPLTPEEVRNYYEWGKSAAGAEPTGGMAPFTWTNLPAAPAPRQLGAGDYAELEKSLADVPLSRLNQDRAVQEAQFLAAMRKRGIADDPAFFQLKKETITEPYTRAAADILSNATANRFNLEASDLARLGTEEVNKYNIAANALNAENTGRLGYNLSAYTAPREFWLNKMKQYYSGTGDTQSSATLQTSKSTSSGQGQSQAPGSTINLTLPY